MRPRSLRTRLHSRLRTLFATVTAGLAAATTLAAAGPSHADAPQNHAQNHACSPAVSLDGFSDALDKTTYEGAFVGNFSALAVDLPHSRLRSSGGTPTGSLLALSDRSALFSLDRRTLRPTGVVPLADAGGAALDSEGLAIDGDGTRLVTSETEPSVRRYDRAGRLLGGPGGSLPVPDALRVAPVGRAATNQTFEGLTFYPGGRTLLASMEGALSGDTAGIVRFQTWERRHGGDFRLSAQYGYRADAGLGVVETAALPDGRLLVLERGFTAGVGNTVRLYLADPRRATDTSGVENLTGQAGVRLIKKTLLTDLVTCPSLGATAKQAQPNPLLDNIEGMTITGRGPGGLRVLLVSDDNQNAVQITRFYRLGVRLPTS